MNRCVVVCVCIVLSSTLSAQPPSKTEALPYLKLRAQRLMESTNHVFAVEHIDQAIEKYPDDAELRFLLGECHFELERMKDAATAFAAGIERAPQMLLRVPHYPLALFRDGRQSDAEAIWRRMLATGESDGIEHGAFGLGLIAMEAGDAEAALEQFRRAREYDPQSAKINFRIGSALKQLGRVEEAYAAFVVVAENDPLHEPALHNLALTAMRLGRRDEAMSWRAKHENARLALTRIGNYRLALSQNARDFDALAALADVYFRAGHWLRSEGLYRALVVERQNDPEPRFRAAYCMFKLKKFVPARQQIEILLRRFPDHGPTLALQAEMDALKDRGSDR